MFYDDGTELINYNKKNPNNTFEDYEEFFEHFGTKRHSGRYPYGSGEHPFQHEDRFLQFIGKLKADGHSEKEIADYFGLTLSHFKTERSIARDKIRIQEYRKVADLTDQGYSPTEIGKMLGKNESSIRTLLQNDKALTRMHLAENTAEELKNYISKDSFLDVGPGVERQIGINRNKMEEALYLLQMEGYKVYSGRFNQAANPKQKTTTTVVCPPGTEHKEIFNNPDKIKLLGGELYSHDGGETFDKVQYPVSIDSKRVQIRYGDEGGSRKDGVIEIRRGVKDLDLDGSAYAQVRIAVDGTHYLKGMAVYSDNMPPGVDIIFNTNKNSSVPKMEVLKKIKTDNPDNPFGANIKKPSAGGQHNYIGDDGKEHLSAINKVNDEGDWSKYSDSLAAQFLSKQPMKLINQQLDKTYDYYIQEYDKIMSLTNPTVRKNRLEEFARDCDGAAVDLKVAAFPRQSWQVILPSNTLNDNEIYARNYNDGETVALVRYPHGGTFEIPILKVNNRNKECENVYGQIKDAVAINGNVAERLSGADFDGDTVLVIPVGPKSKINSTRPILEGFDAKVEYGTRAERKTDPKTGKETEVYYNLQTGKKITPMTNTQMEMGKISNLITDMTLKGAPSDDLARAVKHSQVVIDAEKHHLDYKKSEKDNDIKGLKEFYQGRYTKDGKYTEGAATLISASKSPIDVPERVGEPRINYDPKTKGPKQPREYTYRGEKRIDAPPEGTPLGGIYYIQSGRKYLQVYNPDTKKWVGAYRDKNNEIYYKTGTKKDSNGKTKNVYSKVPEDYKVREVAATEKSKKLAEARDAYSLSSGTPQENAYANYSNKMKDLANKARRDSLDVKEIPYNKEMRKLFQEEVDSLNDKIASVERNKPLERAANRKATLEANRARDNNPDMSTGEYKKLIQQRLDAARAELGAKKPAITITEREWAAIQSGAVNKTTLNKVLDIADSAQINKLAMPRDTKQLTVSQKNRIKAMFASGQSAAAIAKLFGISTSTVYNYIN